MEVALKVFSRVWCFVSCCVTGSGHQPQPATDSCVHFRRDSSSSLTALWGPASSLWGSVSCGFIMGLAQSSDSCSSILFRNPIFAHSERRLHFRVLDWFFDRLSVFSSEGRRTSSVKPELITRPSFPNVLFQT